MIRTVLGDIENTKSGNILMHEHIQIVPDDFLSSFGKKWLDSEKLENAAVRVLKTAKEKFGVKTVVDGTSIDLGRDAGLLQRVSKKSGVNIIASTGLYYYPSMLTCTNSEERFTELFLSECENGIDGTDALPGILKCAADGELTYDMEKRMRAVSAVQSKTGLPMYFHCSHNDDIAEKSMRIFENKNVNPNKTVFGHVSRRLNAEYLKNILKECYYICIDQSFWGSHDLVAQEVYKLCEMGYENKILISHDLPLYHGYEIPVNNDEDFLYNKSVDRFSFLYQGVVPELVKLGFTDDNLERILKLNAREVLNYE